jgi:transcriptional regulator GlxA family with amidase domain
MGNLQDKLPLEDLAGRVGFSPFHFHRVFTEYVGGYESQSTRVHLICNANAKRLKKAAEPHH